MSAHASGPNGKEKAPDWVARIISALGLLVAAVTAYITFVFSTDDLRVVVSGGPLYAVNSDERGEVRLPTPFVFSFINSGTRPAVVTHASLTYKLEEQPCYTDGAPLAMQSAVIKPGEIVARDDVGLPKPRPGYPAGALWVLAASENEITLVPCITFVLDTPDAAYKVVPVALDPIRAINLANPPRAPSPSEARVGAPPEQPQKSYRPHILIQQTQWLGSGLLRRWMGN